MAKSKYIDVVLSFKDKLTGGLAKANLKLQAQEKTVNRIARKFEKTGKTISRTGTKLTKSVTTPLVGIAAASVKTAAEFESGMSKVQSISGASTSELEKLRQKAQEMGAKTKFSATESADAFSYMAMAGWKASDMLNGIEGIMYLAGATGEDLASTSDIVTDSLTALGMKANETQRFVNLTRYQAP